MRKIFKLETHAVQVPGLGVEGIVDVGLDQTEEVSVCSAIDRESGSDVQVAVHAGPGVQVHSHLGVSIEVGVDLSLGGTVKGIYPKGDLKVL